MNHLYRSTFLILCLALLSGCTSHKRELQDKCFTPPPCPPCDNYHVCIDHVDKYSCEKYY